MRDLKELLVGTAGMTRLAVEYADGVQTGKIDGEDFGISLMDCTVKFGKTRNGHVDVTIGTRSEDVTVTGRDVRAVFGLLYGALAAEFGETPDDGQPKPVPPTPDMLAAVALLRRAVAVMEGEADNPDRTAVLAEIAVLAAKYPVPA